MNIKAAALAVVVATVGVAGAVGVAAVRAQHGRGNAVLVLGENLNEPFGVAFTREGAAFIVEMGGNRVTRLSPQGEARVFAGTGEKGLSGDGGPASEARFNGPHHLIMGPDGHLYIADTFNNCVRPSI